MKKFKDRLRITKTSEESFTEKLKYEVRQKIECTCPCCGEFHPLNYLLIERTEYKLFSIKRFRLYRCKNCGAEWEYERED